MAAVTREQLHEMLDLVLDINGMEKRQQSITSDKPTAFMWFNGHTFDVEIMAYKSGWDFDKAPDIRKRIRLTDGSVSIFSPKETWDDVMKELKTIKKTAEIGAQTVGGTDCF